jgi:hypothetical protein
VCARASLYVCLRVCLALIQMHVLRAHSHTYRIFRRRRSKKAQNAWQGCPLVLISSCVCVCVCVCVCSRWYLCLPLPHISSSPSSTHFTHTYFSSSHVDWKLNNFPSVYFQSSVYVCVCVCVCVCIHSTQHRHHTPNAHQ